MEAPSGLAQLQLDTQAPLKTLRACGGQGEDVEEKELKEVVKEVKEELKEEPKAMAELQGLRSSQVKPSSDKEAGKERGSWLH